MATPTYPSKRYYAAGAKKGSVWGTAVALGATDGLLILNDGGLGLKQSYQGYEAIDQIITMDGDLGPSEAIDFAPEFALQYEMGALGRLIAGLFGTAGVPTQQGGTAAYKHVFQWADSVSNFFTVAREWPGKIWEVPSAMPYKLSLKLSNARIMATLGLRGNTLTDASATNTLTQMDAITYASRASRAHFSHGAFWMNAQSGAGLAVGDVVEVSDFEIDYERQIDAVQIAGGTYVALPREGASPKITVKLTLPRASATNLGYLTTFTGMTAQKMSIVFTGALAAAGYYYTVGMYFPRLKLINPPEPSQDDVIKTTLNFQLEDAAAAPTGMSYARPYVEVINLQTTDYLA